MRKVVNFNAGPAMLPEEVLLQAQKELLDWHGTGMSIMELGHRGTEFGDVAKQAELDLRELMKIPENYHVLFLSGGATTQFAMVPINLFNEKRTADYIDTGIWSKKAIAEAKRYGEVSVAASVMQRDSMAYIPHQKDWQLNKDASYVHYTPNETIEGIAFHWVPDTGDVPLVADMSSMLLSCPVDITKYGVIYACAQKNLGQAGITVVIIRDDLLKEPPPLTPTLYSYKLHAENHSFYNTPPTFSWYMTGLVLDWMKRHGGVEKFYKINQRKANMLYSIIDDHRHFYINKIDAECRSMMNVSFDLPNEELTHKFLEESTRLGLTNLRGHRLAGGVRASMYNAMQEAEVERLAHFMRDFVKKHG